MFDEPWQFWIDVGGTFTDCIARRPDGVLVRHKLLSSGVTKGTLGAGSTGTALAIGRYERDNFWNGYSVRLSRGDGEAPYSARIARSDGKSGVVVLESALPFLPAAGDFFELFSGEEAPLVAIRHLLDLSLEDPIPPVSVRLGTTRGTNALLTRGGARTALMTTAGFGDLPWIGYQDRPRLFDLAIDKPRPLCECSLEVDERLSSDGSVLQAPDPSKIRDALEKLRRQGIESLAICLLHAYRNPEHELVVERCARELGFLDVSRSSHVAPLIKVVSRCDTTLVDAYLNPVLCDYVAALRTKLGDSSSLRLLTSAGGLVAADRFSGKDSILSGPAGGVVGFARVARAAGFDRAIGFDMGGTSTDVSRYDGRFELQYETEKAGVRIVAPTLAIETVAAGGGSVCWFDGVKLCVGPESAGADPGPACYGRGGPLAVTDLNLLLGKIIPEYFPFVPNIDVATARLDALREEVRISTGVHYERMELAQGFLRIANARMAKAVRSISIAKGYDPSEYLLVAFGGAAPQHACAIADELEMVTILNHPDAGILSALGAGMADIRRHRVEGIYRPYVQAELAGLTDTFERLEHDAQQELIDEGVSPGNILAIRSLEIRYQGVESTLTIESPDDGDYAAEFAAEHQRLYGYLHAGKPLEIVAARVELVGRSPTEIVEARRAKETEERHPSEVRTAVFHQGPLSTGLFCREDLRFGDVVVGPAIVLESVSTTVIDPGWRAEVLSGGELLLTRDSTREPSLPNGFTPLQAASPPVARNAPADPVLLEIFNNSFAGIAEQMGITLRNTSSSVNVKERLDFSCALFTADGDLVVNAPHIPVHLGAMGETVKRVLQDNPRMRPGDVFVTNDPYRGGSHLPDVTVVTPVHDEQSGERRFLTASRAHHAEIGGTTPGSMPPASTNLAQEGVLIRNFKVVDRGESNLDTLRRLLLEAPFPSRAVDDNLADVSAQIAANRQGSCDLLTMIERHGWQQVRNYMRFIQEAAERKTRAALARLPDGSRHFVDHLDDGAPISLTLTVAGDHATFDFSGTGNVLPNNLNANRAIVTAAVLYCLRMLIDEDVPLNQGVLAPIEIVLPECLLSPTEQPDPALCPAVAGGNVETSQRIVDVILGALGIAGAGQGTMNNVLFGNAQFGYYETICGGSGACRGHAGADAVQVHMTNTRLTDPEVLESRYPVRLLEFSIRRGSGGAGQWPGGNGVVRRLQFLKNVTVSILSQRRSTYAPYGQAGGLAGAMGENSVVRDGQSKILPGTTMFDAEAGDILVVKTPGGGGFGVEKPGNLASNSGQQSDEAG